MNLEGRLIGNRYEILEKIGNGGMATVYKAMDTVLKRYVAVKVLREEFTTDEEFIRRFNTEAQSAASLTHPNIVSIYDVGMDDNIYYIVMELIQGKTLKQIIDEDGVLPWKWSLNIAIQIASALEVAHKNNIVHRDIKPHNIIITEDGVAKVTDFGIAKAVSNSTITAFGTTIGSVHYFSPEHARGGYTDAKSDLYSLGVVMYEMLTGRVPFDADTPVSVALKHMQEKPVEPIKLNASIPYTVNKIINKYSIGYHIILTVIITIINLYMLYKGTNYSFIVTHLRILNMIYILSCIIIIVKLENRAKNLRWLVNLGDLSFGIYFIHTYFISIYSHIFNINNYYINVFVATVFVTLISYFSIVIFKKISKNKFDKVLGF